MKSEKRRPQEGDLNLGGDELYFEKATIFGMCFQDESLLSSKRVLTEGFRIGLQFSNRFQVAQKCNFSLAQNYLFAFYYGSNLLKETADKARTDLATSKPAKNFAKVIDFGNRVIDHYNEQSDLLEKIGNKMEEIMEAKPKLSFQELSERMFEEFYQTPRQIMPNREPVGSPRGIKNLVFKIVEAIAEREETSLFSPDKGKQAAVDQVLAQYCPPPKQ